MRNALSLLRAHPATFRAVVRNRAALAKVIGAEPADRYARFVARVARQDLDVARAITDAMVDPLARLDVAATDRFFRALERHEGSLDALATLARALPALLRDLDDAALDGFVHDALSRHPGDSLRAATFLRRESAAGREAAEAQLPGVALDDIRGTLLHYARAHAGTDLDLRPGESPPFTDGHRLVLPPRLHRYGDDRDRLLYRGLVAHLCGYIEHGTFDLDLTAVPGTWPAPNEDESELERFFRGFPNRVLARDLFHALEDARIDGRTRAAYPGLARALDALGPSWRDPELAREAPPAPAARAVVAVRRAAEGLPPIEVSPEIAAAIAPLLEALAGIESAEVEDVARAVAAAYDGVHALMAKAVAGERRTERGKEAISPRRGPETRPEEATREARRLDARAREWLAKMRARGGAGRLARARAAVRAEDEAKARRERRTRFVAMEATLERQELPGGARVDPAGAPGGEELRRSGLPADPDAMPGAISRAYPEWDATIGDYKPGWAIVREQRLRGGSRAAVDQVRARERALVSRVRRQFEALRPEGIARARGMPDGNELDIDRVVEARVAMRASGELPDRVYDRAIPRRREVSAAFLVDLSSSTNESASGGQRRIIDVEKDALVVVAEALSALGDPFATWGFSGYGREHVAFYVAKEFSEPLSQAWERIGRMSFRMENRDGAAIRHATAKLRAVQARTRMLFLLSDGKPLDCGCDQYHDRYAQEDTRVALREARTAGITPFCITVDPRGPAYLARMYGDVAYTVIDRLESLPSRLVHVYRRLAT